MLEDILRQLLGLPQPSQDLPPVRDHNAAIRAMLPEGDPRIADYPPPNRTLYEEWQSLPKPNGSRNIEPLIPETSAWQQRVGLDNLPSKPYQPPARDSLGDLENRIQQLQDSIQLMQPWNRNPQLTDPMTPNFSTTWTDTPSRNTEGYTSALQRGRNIVQRKQNDMDTNDAANVQNLNRAMALIMRNRQPGQPPLSIQDVESMYNALREKINNQRLYSKPPMLRM